MGCHGAGLTLRVRTPRSKQKQPFKSEFYGQRNSDTNISLHRGGRCEYGKSITLVGDSGAVGDSRAAPFPLHKPFRDIFSFVSGAYGTIY
jgi:hypothetical protein